MGNTLVIVGSQWGDEGKGKITDYLAQKADVVVRYQGGNNAGHTIVFDNKKFALQTIPSGIFSPKIKNVMANGMVLNPKSIIEELAKLESLGIKDYQLYISNRAAVVMPYHILLDGAYEKFKGNKKIGTTKKGIGPAYTDKVSRIGLRMGDLKNFNDFSNKLVDILKIKNMELNMLELETLDYNEILSEYKEYSNALSKYICDTSLLLNEELEASKKILFEGAQGVMLGIDHGTYPFVTSSNPSAASVPINCGIAPKYISNILGICKAYTTRVGEGPFPTEITSPLASEIREKGHEFGTVTKRPRRIGYLDAVVLNHGRRVSGLKYLSIMLLDVLSGLEELKICYSYTLDGKEINYIPSTLEEYSRVKPNYVVLKGWSEDISNVTSYDMLPQEAKDYLAKIEEITNIKVALFSVGPDRKQTIIVEDIF